MPKIIKVAKGTYTATDITVDSDGRVITASSGSAGANLVATFGDTGPSSGTYTAQPGANYIVAYVAGGGGGAGRSPGTVIGAAGGFAAYATPISQPYAKSYSIGARGTGQIGAGIGGNAGGATTFGSPATVTANGGNAGAGPGGAQGSVGTVAGETMDLTSKGTSTQGSTFNKSIRQQMGIDVVLEAPGNFDVENRLIYKGQGGPQAATAGESGKPGGAGFIYVYENLGS
jgi:hypothetical protein